MNSRHKILSRKRLLQEITKLKKKGKTIAFTNGCFDLLHKGHVRYLEAARKKDRVLIVGLNSDKSVREIKGPKRPIMPEQARAEVLAGLGCVDFISIFDEDTPKKLIEAVGPDVLIKGADWKGKPVAGADIVKRLGGKVEYISYVPDQSSTNIIERVLKAHAR